MSMSFKYKSNEQVAKEIKKLMLDEDVTQKNVADELGVTPQAITKLLNKKNLSFSDVKKILNTFGYDLVILFGKNVVENEED